CRIVDTRKTTPGYRVLEKAAVAAGGCGNHRFDLGSGVLIKDNHIAACGGVVAAVERARARAPHPMRIECEVTSTAQLDEALAAGRGRLGRPWASPPGPYLYLSAVVRLTCAPAERAALTLAVGIGVVDAVRAAVAAAAGLKWPNDVLVDGKKLPGVLCEATGD